MMREPKFSESPEGSDLPSDANVPRAPDATTTPGQDGTPDSVNISDADLEKLVQLDRSAAASEDATKELNSDAPSDLKRAARGLHFIQRVQDENPHCVDDLAAASSSDWLHIEGEQPTRIGRHEIRGRLGSGGFGVVFRAFDPELEREVALKVPRVETLINAQTRRRFLRESKTAARLNHPNIATVFEAGTVGPVFYIASEIVPGGSLDDFLRESPERSHLEPRAAASLMAAISEAVDHAHQKGILHRDIKPSNVLLDIGPEDRHQLEHHAELWEQVAKLVDFGLAKQLESKEDETRSGIMLGTPAFSAPEMILDRANAGVTADVYSLGATLYHALTGKPPHKKATDFETLLATQNEEAEAPSRHVPEIPRDVDAICLKCLEKKPADRYASAADVAHDLRRFLDGKPVRARHSSRLEKSARWCRRNPSLTAMLLSIAVLLGITAWSLIYTLQTVRSQRLVSAQLGERLDNLIVRRVFGKDEVRRSVDLPPSETDDPSPQYKGSSTGSPFAVRRSGEIQIIDAAQLDVVVRTMKAKSAFCFSGSNLLVAGTEWSTRPNDSTTRPIDTYVAPSFDDSTIQHRQVTLPTATARIKDMSSAGDLTVLLTTNNRIVIANRQESPQATPLPPVVGTVNSISLNPAKDLLAVAMAEDVVRLINTKTAESFGMLANQPKRVRFSPDGQWLAVVEPDQVRLFRRPSWSETRPVPHDYAGADVAFSRDGRLVAVTTSNHAIQLYRLDVDARLITPVLVPNSHSLVAILFTGDGRYLLAGTRSGTLYRWDLKRVDGLLETIMDDWSPLVTH